MNKILINEFITYNQFKNYPLPILADNDCDRNATSNNSLTYALPLMPIKFKILT